MSNLTQLNVEKEFDPILRLERQTRPCFKIAKSWRDEHPLENRRPVAEILATVGER